MSCCDTKIIQVGGAAGGGPYTVAPNTPTDQFVTITDTASGNTFVIDLSKAIAITDADGDTGVATVEGGGANGGDKTVFNVDGVEVGSVEILLGGLTKWTFDGLVDPVAFLATPQTAVAIAAFSPTAGWLVYNGDTNAYQYYNGTSWVVLPGATTVKAWAATTAYAINEVVSATSPSTGHVGLYRRIAAGTSGATFNTGEEANWATLSTVGASRVFLSDTTVAPAIAGEPTVAEITVAVTASNVKDLLVYYTGTNTAGDTPTYVYWVDAAGTVTTIQSPSSSTARLVSAPGAPPSGYEKLYPRTDGAWYRLNSAGVETRVFPLDRQTLQSTAVSTTSSTTLQNKINTTITVSRAATYKVTVGYRWNYASTANDFIGDLMIDGASLSSQAPMHRQEPRDVAGAVPDRVPGTVTDQRFGFSAVFVIPLTAAAHTVQLLYASSKAGKAAAIWDAFVILEEI